MSDTPSDEDFVLPQEGSTDETAEFADVDQFAEVPADAEVPEEEDVALQAEDEEADVVPVVADEAEAEVEEVEEADEEEAEEEPSEPGLSTAGQYLAASSIAFGVVLAVVGIFALALKRFPLEAGVALIVVPISLVCLACSIVGLLAKPEKREKLLLIPTLGPLLPLGAIILFIIAMLNEMKS